MRETEFDGLIPSFEPVRGFLARFSGESSNLIRRRSLGPEDRYRLVEQVRGLYDSAYASYRSNGGELLSKGDLKQKAGSDLPVRLLVRDTVNSLDARRYEAG